MQVYKVNKFQEIASLITIIHKREHEVSYTMYHNEKKLK